MKHLVTGELSKQPLRGAVLGRFSKRKPPVLPVVNKKFIEIKSRLIYCENHQFTGGFYFKDPSTNPILLK